MGRWMGGREGGGVGERGKSRGMGGIRGRQEVNYCEEKGRHRERG